MLDYANLKRKVLFETGNCKPVYSGSRPVADLFIERSVNIVARKKVDPQPPLICLSRFFQQRVRNDPIKQGNIRTKMELEVKKYLAEFGTHLAG